MIKTTFYGFAFTSTKTVRINGSINADNELEILIIVVSGILAY